MKILAALGAVTLSIAFALAARPPAPPGWHDPSKHEVRFVMVDEGVRLEVLDWGGTGRPIVLLAGFGHSAHVFDDFAPKLTDTGRVLAVTRRGHGASSHPASGYDDQRLADDVLAVLDALSLEKPVLAGHSLGGSELTTLGNQHSARLAGLVYLDALQDGTDFPSADPAYMELFHALPAPMRSPRCTPETNTVKAFREAQMCNDGSAFPESELRHTFAVDADGTMGRHKSPPNMGALIAGGQIKRNYSKIRVPVLALCEFPRPGGVPAHYQPKDDAERAAILAFGNATKAYTDRWAASLLNAVPDARIVDMRPGAGHFVFRTREAEVLQEMRTFVARLRAGRAAD
jgi:non-heme chloroperoxidase